MTSFLGSVRYLIKYIVIFIFALSIDSAPADYYISWLLKSLYMLLMLKFEKKKKRKKKETPSNVFVCSTL